MLGLRDVECLGMNERRLTDEGILFYFFSFYKLKSVIGLVEDKN